MFHSYVRRPEAKSGVAQYVASIVCSIDSRPKIRRANPSSPEGQKKRVVDGFNSSEINTFFAISAKKT